MNDFALKPSELKSLLRYNAIGNYTWTGFLRSGHFPKLLLENRINNQVVVGRIMPKPSDGELKLWPKLQHQNLNPLIENLCINDKVSVSISPAVGKCIGILVHESNFRQHPLCFDRKKSYAKDILSGLNYMHQNFIFLLNLGEESVEVCSCADKAVICDFSFAVSRTKVTKKLLPSGNHYKPPEVEIADDSEYFHSSSIDIWDYGILLLQVFTQHLIPWPGAVNDSLELLDVGVLKKANSGSCLRKKMADELKSFFQELLSQNPDLRPSTEEALQSNFLQSVYNRPVEKARQFWQAGGTSNTRNENMLLEDQGRNSSSSSDEDVWEVSKSNANPHQNTNKTYKIDKAQLVRTKSEPYGAILQEVPYQSLAVHTSYPVLFKSSNSERSSTSSEESIPEQFFPLFGTTALSNSEQNDIDRENASETAITFGDQYDTRPYDTVAGWDPDIFPKLDGDSSSFNRANLQANIEDDQVSKSSFVNNLEQMMSGIMSISGLSLDLDSPVISSSRKTPQRESHEIDKRRRNDGGYSFRHPNESKSPSLPLNKNPNYKTGKTPLENSDNEISVVSNNSNMDFLNVDDKRDSRIKSEIVSDDEIQAEESVSPKRKKWYHKLCVGCRSKRRKKE